MTTHRKTRPPKAIKRPADKPPLPAEPLSMGRLEELRKEHLSGRLSADRSLALILAGNKGHVSALEGSPMKPAARYGLIKSGKADFLVIRCSDARVNKSDSERDSLVGLHISIAGNVIPGGDTVSRQELAEAVSRVRPGGVVVVEGHCHCGAVNECVKWAAGGKGHTGSEPLDNLLHEIVGSDPESNALGQLSKLEGISKALGRKAGCMIYDWDSGTVTVLSKGDSPLMGLLSDSFKVHHDKADADGKLAEKLANQKPHAIAIAYSLLPFSISTITGALQNEIFNTTGSEGGLDDFDAASILYAVEHLGVRHIPFIAPLSDGEPGKAQRMFDRWERDIRGMTVHGEPLMAKMLDSGELKISRLGYDLATGQLKHTPKGSGI